MGVALATSLGAWAGLVAGSGVDGPSGVDARPLPFVGLIVACTGTVAGARWLSRRSPPLVPGLVALAAVVALVAALPDVGEAAGAPLGYANANATLASLGALAAAGAALASTAPGATAPSWPTRSRELATSGSTASGSPTSGRAEPPAWLWWGVAVGLGFLTMLARSTAGTLSLAVAGGLVGLAVWRRQSQLAVLGGALVAAVVVAGTVLVGAGAAPARLERSAGLRSALWVEAVELTEAHPVVGVGPGGFAQLMTTTDDPDLAWAHNEYLQVAAELGLPGVALVLALLAWAYARLWVSASHAHSASVAVGAGALTLVALHASVDYIVHLPAVPLTLAALHGWSTTHTSHAA